MKLGPSILREAVVVLAGAIVAAWVIGQVPEVRAWISRQWGEAKPPGGGCSCGG